MFKRLLNFVKYYRQQKREERKYQREIDLRVKKFRIKCGLIKWYMDYDRMYNVVDIPAHIRADRVMRKTIKRPSDIDRAYKKLMEYEQLAERTV